ANRPQELRPVPGFRLGGSGGTARAERGGAGACRPDRGDARAHRSARASTRRRAGSAARRPGSRKAYRRFDEINIAMAAVYPHPIIAREGWVFLTIAIVVALALSWLGTWWLAAIAWLAAIFIGQFFRDSPRAVPQQPNAVLSPADGKIVLVGHARDPYLDRAALKISVFMNVFNVHSNRSPVDGDVKQRWYHEGKFFNAALDKSSLDNE